MIDPVYILTFDQWTALTSAVGHLKGTGEGLLDAGMAYAAQGCIDKADEAFAAVKGVRPQFPSLTANTLNVQKPAAFDNFYQSTPPSQA